MAAGFRSAGFLPLIVILRVKRVRQESSPEIGDETNDFQAKKRGKWSFLSAPRNLKSRFSEKEKEISIHGKSILTAKKEGKYIF